MQPPDTRRVLVSVADAAVRLGISQTEVRRQVKAGKLEAESFDRPQGSYIRVVFYEPEDAPPHADQEESPTRQDTPEALMSVLADLTATHERLYEAYREIAALRERAARAEADAGHATADAARLRAELETARRPWWRFWRRT